MDDDGANELTALRARAYGPDADIDGDPAARARLEALEANARAARRPPAPTVAPRPAPPLPAPATPTTTTASTIAVTPTSTAAQPMPARKRLWAATWAGSLAAVATVAVAVTAAASAQFAWPATGYADAGVTRVASLAVDPDSTVTSQYFGGDIDATVHESFAGVTAFTFTYEYPGGEAESLCIAVVPERDVNAPRQPSSDDDSGQIFGPLTQSCSAGAFPAAASMVVTDQAPAALRERFAVGSSLQFVHHGGEVEVFAADPAPTVA
ncbi:hypothetical protein [Microbacterium dauci]|uniref:Uncharacterized protein n=1 Tax=Microbacterium dauci TaxID=3048008 RepID=A0ABT6ZI93_9MICO|nr:hypothetical protein [Microbacterium sp. LX3-4]MDJ1115455.1 hypothetical protein [Microbacterium sp. LX3-4]